MAFDQIRFSLFFSERRKVFLLLGYCLYFFLVMFMIINQNLASLIDFPNVLLLVAPYFLIALLNPTLALSLFIIYSLTGLKSLSPAYGTFLSLSILLELCLAVSLFFQMTTTKRYPNLKNAASVLLVLFSGIYLFSAFLNKRLFIAGGGGILKTLLLMLIFYVFIIYFINSHEKLSFFFRALVLLSLSWFGITLVQILRSGLEPFFLRTRTKGYFGSIMDLNELATSILMFLPIILFELEHEKSIFWKRLSLVCFPVALVNVILTFSRNGFINMVIVLFLIFYKGKISKKTWALIFLILLIFLLTPSSYWSRMGTIPSYQVESGLKDKLSKFQSGLEIFLKHPLTGVGFGNSFAIHNTLIQIAADLGLLTLGLFLGLIFLIVKNLQRLEKYLNDKQVVHWLRLPWLLTISLVAYLVGGLSISIPLFSPFFMLVAIVSSFKNIYLEQELVEQSCS